MPDWIVTAALAAAGVWAVLAYAAHAHHHIVEHVDRQIRYLERVMMTNTQDAVNALTEKLGRVRTEILEKLADAQDQIDAAGVADEVDLSALNAAAQALDDIVPDAPEVTDEAPPAEVADEVPAEVDAPAES